MPSSTDLLTEPGPSRSPLRTLGRWLLALVGAVVLVALWSGQASAAGSDRQAPPDRAAAHPAPAERSADPRLAEAIAPIVVPVADVAAPVARSAAPVVEPVAAVAAPVVEPAAAAVAPVVEAAAPVVRPALATVAEAAAPVVEPVAAAVAPITAPVVEAAAPLVRSVAPIVEPVVAAVDPVLEPLAPAVEPVTDAVAPLPSTDEVATATTAAEPTLVFGGSSDPVAAAPLDADDRPATNERTASAERPAVVDSGSAAVAATTDAPAPGPAPVPVSDPISSSSPAPAVPSPTVLVGGLLAFVAATAGAGARGWQGLLALRNDLLPRSRSTRPLLFPG